MVAAFPGLAGRLETVAKVRQKVTDTPLADLMALLGQFPRQPRRALARPAQRRLRIASGGRLNQGIKVAQKGRILVGQFLPPAPCDAYWRHRQPLAGPMKAAAIPGLSNRNRSSFATGRWPSPRCSRHPVPGCGPQQQPTDATWLHPAVPPEPDTCPRSSLHHSYPKSEGATQSVQVIFARLRSTGGSEHAHLYGSTLLAPGGRRGCTSGCWRPDVTLPMDL